MHDAYPRQSPPIGYPLICIGSVYAIDSSPDSKREQARSPKFQFKQFNLSILAFSLALLPSSLFPARLPIPKAASWRGGHDFFSLDANVLYLVFTLSSSLTSAPDNSLPGPATGSSSGCSTSAPNPPFFKKPSISPNYAVLESLECAWSDNWAVRSEL